MTAVLRGFDRRRVAGFTQEKPYLLAAYEPLVEIRKAPIEIDGLGMGVRRRREAADRDLARDPRRDRPRCSTSTRIRPAR